MKKLLEKRAKSIAVVVVLFVIINVALSFAYIRGGSLDSESVSTVTLEGLSVGAGRLVNDNKSHIYNLKITYA